VVLLVVYSMGGDVRMYMLIDRCESWLRPELDPDQ